MKKVSQLAYIGLEVSDMTAWVELCRDILGFDVSAPNDDGVVFLRMDEYHHRIALHPGPADDLLYSGWQLPSVEDYVAMKQALTVADVEWVQGTTQEIELRQVKDMVKFSIGGIGMEIFYGPTIEWNRPINFGRPIQGFKTADGGLGHIVVQSNEMEYAVAVLKNTLGFKVSDTIWNISFLHCNSRHHSIAVEPAAEGKCLAHIMVELNSLDDVGNAWDLVREKDTPFMKTIGKHSNDHMVSFYLTSPSGFDIEYGYGGISVNEDTWEVAHHTAPSIWGHKRPGQA